MTRSKPAGVARVDHGGPPVILDLADSTMRGGQAMLPRPLMIAIVCVVVLIWLANCTAGRIERARAPSGLTTISGGIVGSVLIIGRPARNMVRQIARALARTPDDSDEEVSP